MLNKRLQAIADQIEDGSVVLDVGCDHALLDIFLVKERKNIHAIASDISKKALKQAETNLQKYNVCNSIELYHGFGLEAITPNVDTVVISGMGGLNIIDILKDEPRLKNVHTLILSPNTDVPCVREYLTNHNFGIIKEVLVLDRKKYYDILVLKKGSRRYSKQEILLGPCLLKENSPLFQKRVLKRKEEIKNILNSLPKHDIKERDAFREELLMLEQAYKKN